MIFPSLLSSVARGAAFVCMSRRTQKNVGVIGLGIIGRRVAESLRRSGFNVFVWNRTPRPVQNFVGSPAEIAQLCDYVQIFVSDDEALLDIVGQLSPALAARHIVLAHSTVAPDTIRAAAEIVRKRGARLLDTPFTGSKLAAEKGELVYYVGGDSTALQEARPVLEGSSKEIIEMGEIGDASTMKIATNMITAATVQAGAEALALVRGAGMSPDKLVAAMKGNASSSGTLAMKLPKIIEGDYEPHFSIKHMLKDVRIAGRMAESLGIELGLTAAARTTLLEELNAGHGDDDYSAVARRYFPDQPRTSLTEVPPTPNGSAVAGVASEPAQEGSSVGTDLASGGDGGLEIIEDVTPAATDVDVPAQRAESEKDKPSKSAQSAVPPTSDDPQPTPPIENAEPRLRSGSGEPDGEGAAPRRGLLSRVFGRALDY
jgi:3-hydroxyisobutyrate dehydrogenase-like beta-hydroxyacid dehydrogenase